MKKEHLECAGFKCVTQIAGAYDKRHSDPNKDYGIHGMQIRFVLIGAKGATQFVVFTPMHLPHVQDELWNGQRRRNYNPFTTMGADIGYHSPTPRWRGQEAAAASLCKCGHSYSQHFCAGCVEDCVRHECTHYQEPE